MAFPPSAESFKGLHPEDKLKKLVDLDSAIYQVRAHVLLSTPRWYWRALLMLRRGGK